MVRRDQTNEEQRGGAPSSNGASRHAARNTASTSLREPENAADRFAWAEQLALRPRAIFASVQLGSPAVMFHFMQPIGPRGRSQAKSRIGDGEEGGTRHAVEIGRRNILGEALKTVGATRRPPRSAAGFALLTKARAAQVPHARDPQPDCLLGCRRRQDSTDVTTA